MCKYCEGRAPLITTGVLTGHNIDVGIWGDKLIAESRYTDNFGITETVNKGVAIKYCPYCGRPLSGKEGAKNDAG